MVKKPTEDVERVVIKSLKSLKRTLNPTVEEPNKVSRVQVLEAFKEEFRENLKSFRY